MATTSLSIILTVFVLHLHHAGPNNHPVPTCLKNFMFKRVAPFLLMSTVSKYQQRAKLRRKRVSETKLGGKSSAGSALVFSGPGSNPGVMPITYRTTRPPIGDSYSMINLMPGGTTSAPLHTIRSSNGGCEVGDGSNKAKEPLLGPAFELNARQSPILMPRHILQQQVGE